MASPIPFDIDRFFNDQWPRVSDFEMDDFFAPWIDIKEADDHYEIIANMASNRQVIEFGHY